MPHLKHSRAAKFAESKILRRRDITDDLMLMWIEKPQGFQFKAGQYCTIGYDGVERAYSISSAPYEQEIELFIELVPHPEGILTPKLWELDSGDTLTIRPRAKGLFVFKPDLHNQLLISTVTGIVPYISFIRQYLHEGLQDHRFYILHGASYMDEFTYQEELTNLAADHPEILNYVPTISRPKDQHNSMWTGETGRVNNIVEAYVEKFGLKPENSLVYACGHPEMIEDVKTRMLPTGFKIEEERFWKQD